MFFHKSGLASPLRFPSGSNHDHCLIPAVDVTENQMMKMLFVGILDQKFSKIDGVPSAKSITTLDNKKYEGRLEVAMSSLITYFYAARKKEIYRLMLFWGKAQRQCDQAWETQTSMIRYHHPLVLLDEGTRWSFNSYELEEEA
jgi:hypothetical protein